MTDYRCSTCNTLYKNAKPSIATRIANFASGAGGGQDSHAADCYTCGAGNDAILPTS